MARPRFLSRNNDNAPAAKRKADDYNVAKRKADDDNVAPKHVSAAHKAQALQDLIDDDSNARPHVGYLQFLGILPTNFITKTEGAVCRKLMTHFLLDPPNFKNFEGPKKKATNLAKLN